MRRLEHANISVRDPEAITRFLQVAFPDFRIRREGQDLAGRPWRHVGVDDFYVAISEVPEGETRTPYGNSPGLNHLGWEVDDLDDLKTRMAAAGWKHNLLVDDHPARTRIYFHDPEGNDWEFVQYASDDPAQRNDYSDAS